MKLYRELRNQRWLLLGILLPIVLGVVQDKLFSGSPESLTAAHWRAFWLAAANKLQVSGLVTILLLSLAAITGGTIICILLSRRTVNATSGVKIGRPIEVDDSRLRTALRYFHI